MNTYEIETTNGFTLNVEGDHFAPSKDDLTGEFHGYEVWKDGNLAAFIAPDRLVSVIVK